jgi:orotate phosphoribosyltransferase
MSSANDHAGRAPARIVPREDPRLERLHAIIAELSLMTGDFVLSSGRRSRYLFQLRQTVLHPEGAHIIGGLIVEFMKTQGLACLGGLEMGAVPVVTAAAVRSHDLGYPVAAFFARKQAKAHGARERIDGHIFENGEILLVDDVSTTGGSILKALEAIRESGHEVTCRHALTIVDREEGATENLEAAGITLHALLRKSDFRIPV